MAMKNLVSFFTRNVESPGVATNGSEELNNSGVEREDEQLNGLTGEGDEQVDGVTSEGEDQVDGETGEEKEQVDGEPVRGESQ